MAAEGERTDWLAFIQDLVMRGVAKATHTPQI
jgi:hypothetical protein